MRRNTHGLSQGAMQRPDGSVVWRVWAPECNDVALVTWDSGQRREVTMSPEDEGFFVHREPQVAEGLRYGYRLSTDQKILPDPASRWQPEGVHQPSALFVPESFDWSDRAWRGVARDELVMYELHVGTFTAEGTLDAIVPRLPELLDLGVTAVELMPVAQFAGERNWGYDAVYPYAVQNSYGGPRALQRFVDAAHRVGMAVFLDVIYNHLGPEGNYLGCFGPYFTDRYHTPWGKAVNYDGPMSDPVRRFAIDNARMWVRDFHIDGLRLDAVHAIYDLSAYHILAELQAVVQREARLDHREVHVIAETDQNDVRLIRPRKKGGYGLDGVWSDDFHHSVHALLTGERDGYYLDFGRPEHLVKTFRKVFVYDGCYSPFRRRRHGNRVGRSDRTQFTVCIQNHDQIGNRAMGDRLATLVPPAANRLAAGLMMLSPCVPLLFMGEEYGERRPFPFFCSFDDPVIVAGVQKGRREEFAALEFQWGTEIPDALSPETFASAKLDWRWPEGSMQAQTRRLYRDLLAARRRWRSLRDRRHTTARLFDTDGLSSVLMIRRGGGRGLVAVANLSAEAVAMPEAELGGRRLLLSTEDAIYGGRRAGGAKSSGPHPSPLPEGEGTGLAGPHPGPFPRGEGTELAGPHPSPLPRGEGTLLGYELLVFGYEGEKR